MKAIIISDSIEEAIPLVSHLAEIKIQATVTPELDINVLPEEPFLFYRDPYQRIKNPNIILNFAQKCQFPAIYHEKEFVTLTKGFFLGNVDGIFGLNENPVHFEKPKASPPDILMVTHNRPNYLRLSLNALLYALEEPLPKIHILLSAPCVHTAEVAKEFAQKYSNIKIYQSDTNVAVAGFNMLLQWLVPEYFMIWEDDYIIPQHTKYLLPNWNLRLVERLKWYDFAAFSTSTQNCPWDLFYLFKPVVNNHTGHKWFNNIESPPIIGSSVTINAKKYVKLAAPPSYVTGDGTLVEKYKYSISSITGYHIGFNQEVDGYKKIGDYSRFPKVEDDQVVYSDGVTKSFKLTNIKKAFG